MLRKRLEYNIAAILSLLFTHCTSVTYTQIEVLKPAKIILPLTINKLVIINNAYLPNNYEMINFANVHIQGFDSTFTSQYISGLLTYLKQSPRFEIKNVYTINKNVEKPNQKLSADIINEICQNDTADAAIILNDYKLFKSTHIKPVSLARTLKVKENGKVIRVDSVFNNVYAFSLTNSANWLIYYPVKKSIPDSVWLKDSSNYFTQSTDIKQAISQITDFKTIVYNSAYRIGENYGNRIAQQWQNVSRKLYTEPWGYFTDAQKMVELNKWEAAIELWKKCIGNQKTASAARAAYNIAVAYEALDNINTALEWAAKSYFINKSIQTEYYINLLEKRKAERELLMQQLK